MYPGAPRTEWPNLASSSRITTNDAIATDSLGIARLLNHVVSYPCLVLRRQCQVHAFAKKLHLTPITFIPVVKHIISKDGILTLWKGSIGVGVLWGLSQITEIVIADAFGLPRYIIPHGSTEKFWRHIWLKASTFFATTPFIVSSFIVTVRSGVGTYLGKDVGVFDTIFRGIDRLHYYLFGTKDTGCHFSVLYLTRPTVSYFTMHYLLARWAYDCIFGMARRYVSKKPASERTRFHTIMPEMIATMTSPLVADLILYPFETVLHRLYIQGTRTLIDNLDNGVSVANITMNYNGFVNCFQSIVKHEGTSALYSGVGAIVLQCALQLGILWSLRSLLNYGNKRSLLHVAPGQYLSTAITPYTHHNYTTVSISRPTAYPAPQPSTSSTRPVSVAINAPSIRVVTTKTRGPDDIVPYTTPLNLNGHSRLFDRRYDHDFQNYNHSVRIKTFYQAGKLYRRPYGCFRIGINLAHDRHSHKWIKNWHNAYHGTTPENVISIIKQGFKPGHGKYGEGVYCSPDHNLALDYSKGTFIHMYRVVLQVRVQPKAYETVYNSNPNLENEIWLVQKDKAKKIRAYAICLFPINA